MNRVLRFWTTPSGAAFLRLFLVMVIVFGLRLHWVEQVVVDWDESVYAVVARDLVEGGTLYHTTWDHKGPLLYLSLAPIVWLTDGSVVPIRIFTTIWLLITMVFIDLLARCLVGSERSFVAPMVYGLFFSVPRFGGLASNAELFMMLPAAASIWASVRWSISRNRHTALLATAGGLAAIAVLIKPTVLFTVAVAPMIIAAAARGNNERTGSPLFLSLAVFAGGGLAVTTATLAVFAVRRTLSDLFFAMVTFNSAYVEGVPIGESWRQIAALFGWAVVGDVFTVMAVIGAVFLFLRRWARSAEPWALVLVAGLPVLSVIGVWSARNLFFHYYLMMALPIALLITVAVGALGVRRKDWRLLSWIVLGVGIVSAFSSHRAPFERRSRAPENDKMLEEVASWVEENSEPGDTLYVLGGEPILYYLCDRRSPTKYFFWLYLTDRWDAILDSRSVVLEEFGRAPPDWIVYAEHDLRVPELERFLFDRYEPAHEVGGYLIARYRESPP